MEPAGTEGGAAPASAPGQRQRAHALAQYFPILEWGRSYNGAVLTRDLVAAVVVTIMLIPQSLAYALLAGLPPVVGLYASILPLVAYAIFGTSRTLAVGPVAVVSLMTASAAGAVAAQAAQLAAGLDLLQQARSQPHHLHPAHRSAGEGDCLAFHEIGPAAARRAIARPAGDGKIPAFLFDPGSPRSIARKRADIGALVEQQQPPLRRGRGEREAGQRGEQGRGEKSSHGNRPPAI